MIVPKQTWSWYCCCSHWGELFWWDSLERTWQAM